LWYFLTENVIQPESFNTRKDSIVKCKHGIRKYLYGTGYNYSTIGVIEGLLTMTAPTNHTTIIYSIKQSSPEYRKLLTEFGTENQNKLKDVEKLVYTILNYDKTRGSIETLVNRLDKYYQIKLKPINGVI
jgi:hypothetical protein